MTATDKDIIRDRCRALTAAGYRRSDWTATDSALHSAAKWADGRCILDHPRPYTHGEDRVLVCHTYHRGADLDEQLARIAAYIAERWDRDILRWRISDELNIYCPSHGQGYELRRHRGVRAPRMDSW